MNISVSHEPQAQRFIAQVDGHDCVTEYRLADNVMTITHTLVPSAVGGRGIAAELTRVALATARENGWEVAAECSYAEHYIERHPDEVS